MSLNKYHFTWFEGNRCASVFLARVAIFNEISHSLCVWFVYLFSLLSSHKGSLSFLRRHACK
jgi:hypothetical protein